MKKVLSVSLGSTTRDHSTEAEFMEEQFWLSRQGADGDFDRYVQMYRDNDGKVDAFGVGGAEFYLWVNLSALLFPRDQAHPRSDQDLKSGGWQRY